MQTKTPQQKIQIENAELRKDIMQTRAKQQQTQREYSEKANEINKINEELKPAKTELTELTKKKKKNTYRERKQCQVKQKVRRPKE